jgi:anaerobic selenocysteine-containing dehydrogenase
VWVECSAADAQRLGLKEGDLAEVASPRGVVEARVRITRIREGVLFLPFHYGHWDLGSPAGGDADRAANELTVTDWDPVSKQPLFRTASAKLTRVSGADGAAPAPPTTASRPVSGDVPPTRGGDAARVEERVLP